MAQLYSQELGSLYVASYDSQGYGGGIFEVTLRLTVRQSVCLGIEYPCGTCDQILFPVGMLLTEICGLVSIGRPL
jgi:hypothetical protein